MNTFQYQSRNYTPRVDLTTLGKSIDTLEQGHKEAIKTASALETAIANLDMNEAEDGFKQQLVSEIQNTIKENTLFGNSYGALDDLIMKQGNIASDGRVIGRLRSNAAKKEIRKLLKTRYGDTYKNATINPLGEWAGGTNVDCGATNRKLGSDMFDSVTGGGLHGKDLSKGDVSINIYCFIKSQQENKIVTAYCAIGDTEVNVNGELIPYKNIIEVARNYIKDIGGFEKLAKWGLKI